MSKSTITMSEYLKKAECFIIPYYQRGYIWGKKRENGNNSVNFITQNLIEGFVKKKTVFLQGVTVVKKNETIILIDGQQRTTYFLLLLEYLQAKEKINLKYEIRHETEKFLNEIQTMNFEELEKNFEENEKESIQDIYYLKKTLCILNALIEKKIEDREAFLKYILDKVEFLYIEIPEDKATVVFSMMNGNKAQMAQEELIKAEMLRLASSTETQTSSWEQNMLRSRYAREWDRWTYWWNRKDVKSFYRVDSKNERMLGLLLETYFNKNKPNGYEYSFESFRDACLSNGVLSAKQTFYELRHLQKKFEDVFYSIGDGKNLHNKIGAIICLLDDSSQRKNFINKYFNQFSKLPSDYIDLYYRYVFLGLSNSVIDDLIGMSNKEDKEGLEEEFRTSILNMLNSISSKNLYNEDKKYAFLQLLRLNIEEDTKLNRNFDFSFWHNNKSLEHIFPKSKVFYKKDDGQKYYRGDEVELTENEYKAMKIDETCIDSNTFFKDISEHCIGNLVLLHKDDNSSFGNKTFDEKKQMYFKVTEPFKSRHLLHTISVFAKQKWGTDEIKENKENIIKEIKGFYGWKDDDGNR